MPTAYRSSARWILSAPLLLFIVSAIVFPLGYGIYTSTRERSLFMEAQRFVGFEHYHHVLTDSAFWSALWFTVLFTLVTVTGEVILGIGLALLFHQKFPAKKPLMTFVLIPIMIASSLIAVLWRLGLNENVGLVPDLLSMLGLDIVLFSETWILPTVFTAEVLHWTPLVFLLCYAGLQSVPEDLYEASKLDGAGYWRTQWHIVMPHLRAVLAVAVFLRVIDGAKSFDLLYVLTGGGPGTSTTTSSVYIYKAAFVDGNFGLASAASVVMLLLLLVLVPLVVRQVTKR